MSAISISTKRCLQWLALDAEMPCWTLYRTICIRTNDNHQRAHLLTLNHATGQVYFRYPSQRKKRCTRLLSSTTIQISTRQNRQVNI
jgi:hypothetical protein